ncbi:hypothetical protein E5A73_06500 [Sphingomonas gei]|uniref:Lipoprotein n=1 Tax=Sphingomonas gei TaxID=1395960 RepID=A0A4S1XGK2_9SPHN|nr:hypothetical protein [Sphingomonas gei]TGX55077.1 hypothetical protein E5A73_06500 [Sphingomonas gei]
MVRLGVAGLAALLLGGCGGGERSALSVSLRAESSAATVQCVDTSSGLCHVAFATATPLRGDIPKGESRRFEGVVPGTPMCIEPEPVDLSKCNRTAIKQGTQKIARSRVTS